MFTDGSPLRIGILGSDGAAANERHGCGLWPAGNAAAIIAAGATPVPLNLPTARSALDQLLNSLNGVVIADTETGARPVTGGEKLCDWCRKHEMPILAIDAGLHILNAAFGGVTFTDLAREMPEALQHRHPPERGLRHAIETVQGTRIAEIYGEGEVVVNSEHRRAVQRVARGFRVGAKALDGVIEAIESDSPTWFAVGVQWQPASATASGLDIQVFRGLVEASKEHACELVAA
jgi:putative glutamine amidotransferase